MQKKRNMSVDYHNSSEKLFKKSKNDDFVDCIQNHHKDSISSHIQKQHLNADAQKCIKIKISNRK